MANSGGKVYSGNESNPDYWQCVYMYLRIFSHRPTSWAALQQHVEEHLNYHGVGRGVHVAVVLLVAPPPAPLCEGGEVQKRPGTVGTKGLGRAHQSVHAVDVGCVPVPRPLRSESKLHWREGHPKQPGLAPPRLHHMGVQRGATVAIIGENEPQHYWAEFAAHALGCKVVSLYPDLTADEVQYLL